MLISSSSPAYHYPHHQLHTLKLQGKLSLALHLSRPQNGSQTPFCVDWYWKPAGVGAGGLSRNIEPQRHLIHIAMEFRRQCFRKCFWHHTPLTTMILSHLESGHGVTSDIHKFSLVRRTDTTWKCRLSTAQTSPSPVKKNQHCLQQQKRHLWVKNNPQVLGSQPVSSSSSSISDSAAFLPPPFLHSGQLFQLILIFLLNPTIFSSTHWTSFLSSEHHRALKNQSSLSILSCTSTHTLAVFILFHMHAKLIVPIHVHARGFLYMYMPVAFILIAPVSHVILHIPLEWRLLFLIMWLLLATGHSVRMASMAALEMCFNNTCNIQMFLPCHLSPHGIPDLQGDNKHKSLLGKVSLSIQIKSNQRSRFMLLWLLLVIKKL